MTASVLRVSVTLVDVEVCLFVQPPPNCTARIKVKMIERNRYLWATIYDLCLSPRSRVLWIKEAVD